MRVTPHHLCSRNDGSTRCPSGLLLLLLLRHCTKSFNAQKSALIGDKASPATRDSSEVARALKPTLLSPHRNLRAQFAFEQ